METHASPQINDGLAVVILAAGKGTRMKSDLPKVLHALGGRTLLSYTLDLAQGLQAGRVVVVVGHQAQRVRDTFGHRPGLRYALQEPQLGTGHAVMAAAPDLADWTGPVLILCGDVPGLRPATIETLIAAHQAQGNALTVLAMDLPKAGSYGRLILNAQGRLTRIVEYRDASEVQRAVTLVNAGIYLVQAPDLLAFLPRLDTSNDQKEYYLTDLAHLMAQAGRPVGHATCPDHLQVAGVNSVEELKALEAKMI